MGLVILKGSVFKHSLNESDLSTAIATIEAATSAAKALRSKIAQEVTENVPGLPAIQEFLTSHEVKLACAFEAAKKRPWRNRPTFKKVLSVPASLKLNKPLPEIDRVRVKQKKKGGLRFLHDFGLVRRTAQQMILRVMEKLFVPRAFQHTFDKQGLPHTIGLAKAGLLEGKLYYATLDIENHNGSFSTKKLAKQLPIPKEWVDYVVGGRHAVVEIGTMPSGISTPLSQLLLLAQRGLPLGAICSPIIAAYSISFLQWTPGPGWMLLNYADNFLLLASDASVLEEKIAELITAVGKLPGGKFILKLESFGQAEEGLTFLGHTLTLTDGELRISPSALAWESICLKGMIMASGVTHAISSGDQVKALRYVKDYCATVKGWLIAFAACDNIAGAKVELYYLIKQNAYPLDIDVDALMHEVHADYDHVRDDYQYV